MYQVRAPLCGCELCTTSFTLANLQRVSCYTSPVCAVPKEHIAGRAARFVYDSIVDRDLIVLADDVASLPEPPKQSQRSQEERAADAIQKMSNLLGKSELSSIFRAFVSSHNFLPHL